MDREGSFWASLVPGDGVRRISRPEKLPGRTTDSTSTVLQKFTRQDGLTSNAVEDVLEDHEGNIWIATSEGLDRFRRKNVFEGPFPTKTTYFNPFLVTDRKGIIWEGSDGSLLTVANDRASVREGLRLTPPFWLPDWPSLTSGWVDFEGAFWIGGRGTLTRWTGGRPEKIEFPSGDAAASHMDVQSITGKRTGDIWVSIQQHGIYRRHKGVWEPYGGALGLPASFAAILSTDSADRLWFGYMNGQIALGDGDRVRIFSAADGLHVGNVLAIGGAAIRSGRRASSVSLFSMATGSMRLLVKPNPISGVSAAWSRPPTAISGSTWRPGSPASPLEKLRIGSEILIIHFNTISSIFAMA